MESAPTSGIVPREEPSGRGPRPVRPAGRHRVRNEPNEDKLDKALPKPVISGKPPVLLDVQKTVVKRQSCRHFCPQRPPLGAAASAIRRLVMRVVESAGKAGTQG